MADNQNENLAKTKEPATHEVAAEVFSQLSSWAPKNLDDAYELSTRSLETVTHLTEHEDEKANRISTAVAFLSAFSSVLLSVVAQLYPPAQILTLWNSNRTAAFLLASSYVVFAVHAVLLVVGVVVALLAVRPRFNVPKEWSGGGPKSFLFFEKIAETTPGNWADAFVNHDAAETLKLEYAKNNIFETYLIAQKIGWKVSKLKVAVRLYIASVIALAVWIVVSAIGIYAARPVPQTSSPVTLSRPSQPNTAKTIEPDTYTRLTTCELATFLIGE